MSLLAPSAIPEIEPGCDLAQVILDACRRVDWTVIAGDCFVVAQKIVSKSEGRYVRLDDVVPCSEAVELAQVVGKDPRIVELVLRESVRIVRAAPGVLIVQHKLGHVLANAGVDQSNVPDESGTRALLLPEDPDTSARNIAQSISRHCSVPVSVLINDSFGRPWREGVCGTAIGVYGLPALIDRRGYIDRCGKPLQITTIGFADEIAAAASILMGQANESRPVVCIRGLPFDPDGGGISTLLRAPAFDLFR